MVKSGMEPENETEKCIVPASDVEGVPSVLVFQAE